MDALRVGLCFFAFSVSVEWSFVCLITVQIEGDIFVEIDLSALSLVCAFAQLQLYRDVCGLGFVDVFDGVFNRSVSRMIYGCSDGLIVLYMT